MRKFPLLAAVVLTTFPWGTLPAAEPESESASRVNQLIQQLGSRSYREREAATESLDQLGPAALDALRRACLSDDEEVCRRAEELVQRIEKRQEVCRLLEPSRLRLICQDTPLLDAVAELRRLSGVPLLLLNSGTSRFAARNLSFDTGETGFWDALQQLCDQAGLIELRSQTNSRTEVTTWHNNGLQGVVIRSSGYSGVLDTTLRLVQGDRQSIPTAIVGALRFRALPANSVALTHHFSAGETGFLLEVMPEPRLLWQGIVDVRVEKALDDRGQLLEGTRASLVNPYPTPPRPVMLESELDPAGTFTVTSVRLQRQAMPSRLLKEFKAIATVQLQTSAEPLVTIADVLQSSGRSFKGKDGSTIKVVQVHAEEDGKIVLRLHMDLVPAGVAPLNGNVVVRANRNVRLWVRPSNASAIASNLILFDQDGKPFRRGHAETALAANGNALAFELRLTFHTEAGQKQADRLVYLGRRTVLLDVPFAFKDVPLP